MNVVVIDPPGNKPISLDEVKAQCRVDHGDDDAFLNSLIDVAVGHLDAPTGWLGRSLITRTLELRLDRFPACDIEIPYPPIASIDSVKYDDADGAEQTVISAVYRLVGTPSAPRLVLAYGQSWPSARCQPESVRIRYTAGYGETGSDVPAPIRHAMLMMISSWYEQRETEVTGQTVEHLPAVDALLMPYRVF